MKIQVIFFSISLYWFLGQTMAQKTAFVSTNQSFVYYKLDNDIKYSIDNYTCDSIIIKTDNGTIQNYDNCQCKLIPSERRNVNLSFFTSKNGDTVLIGTKTLSVKIFTDFIVNLTTYQSIQNNLICTGALLATDGVVTYAKGYCSEYFRPKIVEIRVVGVRNLEPLFDLKCQTCAFSNEIREAFKKMKTGDKLFILTYLNSVVDDVLQQKTISLTIK